MRDDLPKVIITDNIQSQIKALNMVRTYFNPIAKGWVNAIDNIIILIAKNDEVSLLKAKDLLIKLIKAIDFGITGVYRESIHYEIIPISKTYVKLIIIPNYLEPVLNMIQYRLNLLWDQRHKLN